MSFDLADEEYVPPPPPPPRVGGNGVNGVRSLPHSLESEEYLLSCCLLDPADMVPRCEEAKITPDDFYDPKHGIIYDLILRLLAEQKAVDVSVIAEELKKSRQLDMVGGYAFLAQVTSRIPTTAQGGYFIERVREQSLLRQLIRSSTSIVEDAYGFSGDIESFTATSLQKMESVVAGATGGLAALNSCEFNIKEKIEEGRVAFSLGGIPIMTGGNISAIVSRPGVGKSAFIGAMLAASIVKGTDDVDTLQITGPNYAGLPLLHFDTEQSKGDWQTLLHRVCRRAKKSDLPPWFHSFHLTGKPANECRHLVETAISHYARKAKGELFAVIIDGWADLVVDPNDTGECFPFVSRMHKLAIRTSAPIMGVLHLNPGKEEKSRGHLGSQLERKAETVLQMDMDESLVTAVFASKKRGKPILRADGPRFSWSDEHQMHATVKDWKAKMLDEREQKKREKEAKRPTAFKEQYDRMAILAYFPISTAEPLPRQQLLRMINDTIKLSDRQFSRVVTDLEADKLITRGQSGYVRTEEGDLWVQRPQEPEQSTLDGEFEV